MFAQDINPTMTDPAFETIIGLEVHVQLLTATKMFCRCRTRFGAAPNTQTCPVCTGLPGALPVMNREAFRLSMKTAIALNCEISHFTKWDRKQYYYPDLPKGYQISQFDLPMSHNGHLDICDSKDRFRPTRIGIIRAHLEEDAGKSTHDEISGRADSRIDLNRTGTPLLEIVSEPDLRSPLEARAYLDELKLLLTYLGVSDCNMQEGSLRVDANVNLHVLAPEGKVATPIVEVKNMNSFRAVERALAYEIDRQYELFRETGQRLGEVPKQTRGWDEAANMTLPQRSKEESSDYRYFPDPDLVPVTVTGDEVEAVRSGLAELPAALRSRLETTFNITPYDADVLVNQGRPLVDYFISLAEACHNGKTASNWMQQAVMRTLNDQGTDISDYPVGATQLGELIVAVSEGKLDTSRAREVLQVMIDTDKGAAEAMDQLGIGEVDESDLVSLCQELLDAHPKVVQDLKEGKMKAVGLLIGQAKKKNPNVNPGRVREICIELAGKM